MPQATIIIMLNERIAFEGSISRSDEDDLDGEYYDDYDEHGEISSLWDDLRSSWRQHCVAILIAIFGTAFAYMYQHLMIFPSISSKYAGRRLSTISTSYDVNHQQPHAFLEDFRRTANISFCPNESPKHILSDFDKLQFHVPADLIETIILHYQLDVLQEDDVRSYVKASKSDIDSSNEQIQCLLQLKDSTPHEFITGVTYIYKKPSIESMRRSSQVKQLDSSFPKVNHLTKDIPVTETVLTFTGFAAKFVNMGTTPILLYWDGRGGDDRNRRLVGEIPPFEALTTATRPGESFSVSPTYDRSLALDRWTLTSDDAVQYFEPIIGNKPLNDFEKVQYDFQKLNKEFAKHYLIHSGRTWLSHFPRAFPIHFMWNAEYFGQHHEVEYTEYNIHQNGDKATKKYTLEVVSVMPRVFKIENFLSTLECDALVQIAIQNGLEASTVYSGGDSYDAQHFRDASTRSSTNTWLTHDHHINLTDTIYRRAAHALKIDEALFGHKAPIDDGIDDAKYHSIAESLQVVRYKVGEEYSPHHDWVVPSQLSRYQPTRFATLLIYLNDDFDGGETSFPRAINTQYHEGITIKPQKGTAILFYNLLSDGNVDDLSQHGSNKVTKGEKFAANLWIWDSVIN